MKGYKRYDKNTIYLPRQYLPFPHGRVSFEGYGSPQGYCRGFLHCFRGHQLGGDRESRAPGDPEKAVGAGDFLRADDYRKYDYIIGMDAWNLRNILSIVRQDPEGKVHLLLDFGEHPRDIADPWYTGDFETTYRDILEGLEGFLKHLGYGER